MADNPGAQMMMAIAPARFPGIRNLTRPVGIGIEPPVPGESATPIWHFTPDLAK
jgi:hypothetical protein